jgi:phosphate transport system substrate-binding protein
MKKSLAIFAFVIVFVLSLVVCAVADEVVVSTGPTFINGVFNPLKEPLKAVNISVNILVAGPVDALKNLEDGKAEVAGASLSLDEWIKAAEKAGYQVKDKQSLVPFTVTEEATLVIVSSTNPVTSLTKEQLKDIFSGKITNWKDVGGKDMPVIVVWPKLSSGAMTTFSKQIMDGEAITKDILDVPSLNDVSNAVASNPEAISIANPEKFPAQVKVVQTPKISRPLTLITRGKPSQKVQKLYDFIKGEGQKYIIKQ